MADSQAFTKLVPGFEFLQGLVKNAGSSLPAIGQWVAPTLDPQELEKRIEELRTVQFWLEQNARMLGATIQALEVQRMTLTTLQTMNVQMDDLRESLKVSVPSRSGADEHPQQAASSGLKQSKAEGPAGRTAASAPQAAPATGPVDPMQWWGALTKQFSELAGNAIREGSAESAGPRSGPGAAEQAVKKAAAMAQGGAARKTSAPRKRTVKKAG